MICPNCKIIVPGSSEFCQKCQSPNSGQATEKSIKAEKLKEMLICPKCGALHTPTAKLCRYDGMPLSRGDENKQKANIEEKKKSTISFSLRAILFFSIFAILLSVVAYFYLARKPDIKAIGSEQAISPKSKETSHNESEEKKKPDFALIEIEINRTLRKNGIYNIYVEVEKDLSAIMTGTFLTKKDKQKALGIIKSYKELLKITDDTKKEVQISQASPQKLQYQIDKALKDSGINSVIVDVNDSIHVVLKGVVRNEEEKKKVFEIASLFKDIKGTKDLIFIVEH